MLEQVLDYIHNYFVKEVHTGTYAIQDGKIELNFLQENQYFKIVGSVFNDGVHQYNESLELSDEVFEGAVWAMAVPPAVISICDEIDEWQEKYGEIMDNPYSSESFGGYSYSKPTNGGSGKGGSTTPSWRNVFGSRLNQWRKII